MKSTKAFYPDGFYIFESTASANSNYIENLKEAKLMLTYFDYYLKDYLELQEYCIDQHGFHMAVKLKKAEDILVSYRMHGGSEDIDITDMWRIISNRMRLFLSTYVRRINFLRGRQGVLVRNSYRRYFFENLEEALEHLENMREQKMALYQRKKKYWGLKKHYRIDHSAGEGSVILCSKDLKLGRKEKEKIQLNWALPSLVVRNWTISTQKYQKLFHSHSNHRKKRQHPPDN